MEFSLNGDWKYIVDPKAEGVEKGWDEPSYIEEIYNAAQNITIPNCWNIKPEIEKYEGTVWFFKRFNTIPGYNPNYDLYIRFKAVNYHTKVWINGLSIGENNGGFLPFKFKIMPEILSLGSDNYICVCVENYREEDRIPCRTFDWFNYGGIYRNVDFLILEKTRINWVKIAPKLVEKNCATYQIDYELVSLKNENGVPKFQNQDINWNCYYLGDLSTLNSVTRGNVHEQETSLSEKADMDDQNANEADLIGSESGNDLRNENPDEEDILDELIREPIKFDEIKPEEIAPQKPNIKGVLIKSGSFTLTSGLSKGSFSISIEEPHLWSPESPELYQLEIMIKGSLSPVQSRFGIREIKTSGTSLLLNGKQIKLFGVCLHEELMPYGRAIPTEQRINDVLSIKSIGFNALRTAHYPHDESLLDIADEEGLLILEEIPVYWGIKFQDVNVQRTAARMLRKLIRRDINHPCVIMWSCGNEIPIEKPACEHLMENLLKLGKSLDSSRLVSYVGMRTFSDFTRRKTDINCVNTYFGWYYLSPYNFNFSMDAMRYTNPKKPWLLTEFGADARRGVFSTEENKRLALHTSQKSPIFPESNIPISTKFITIDKRLKFSEEYQASIISHHIKVLNSKDYIAGWFIWIYRDFQSHMRTNQYQQGFNRKGLVDDKNQKKLLARWMPKLMHQKLPTKLIKNYHLAAALFLFGGWPLFKIAGLMIGAFSTKFSDVGDKFYTKIPKTEEKTTSK
jgi:beta-galactosidase/beta-glucuronidase